MNKALLKLKRQENLSNFTCSNLNYLSNKYDQWQVFNTLNAKKITTIIKFTVLLLLINNKRLTVYGKNVQQLINLFGKTNYLLAKNELFILETNLNSLPVLNQEFISQAYAYLYLWLVNSQLLDWAQIRVSDLANYTHKANLASEYFSSYSNTTIKKAILLAFKLKCSNSYCLS